MFNFPDKVSKDAIDFQNLSFKSFICSSPSILIVSVKILAMGSFLSPHAQCVQSCLAITCPVITRVDYKAVGRASRFFCIIYTVHI